MTINQHFIVNQASANHPIPQIVVDGYIGKYENASFSNFRALFLPIEAEHKRMELLINSAGGSMNEGFAIYDLLKNSPCIIDVQIIGMAASMGGVLAMAGDSIRMNKHASFMTHRPQLFVMGESEDLRAQADYADKLEKQLKSIYMGKTGKSEKEIEKWFKAGTQNWFTAEECLQHGLIDMIVDGPAPSDELKNTASEKEAWQIYNSVSIPNHNNFTKENTMNKQLIIDMLNAKSIQHSLTVNSADAEFLAFLGAQLDLKKSAENKVVSLEKKAKDEHAAEVKNVIDSAISAGKINENEREVFTNMANADLNGTKAALSKMQGTVDINIRLQNNANGGGATNVSGKPQDRSAWSWDDWCTNDYKGLMELEATNPELWNKLTAGK